MCASLLSFLDTNLNYTQIEVILIFTCTYISTCIVGELI